MRSPTRASSACAATGAAADDPPVGVARPRPGVGVAATGGIGRQWAHPRLVHNAGIAAVGSVEDMPSKVWEQMFSTNLFGPVALTKALLPCMRAAGRGRIVVVSSQGGTRGMPAISAYSASKGALERWAEALAEEVAPFGLGVTILVSGSFQTDILTDRPGLRDYEGPYAVTTRNPAWGLVVRMARPPERSGAGRMLGDAHHSPSTRWAGRRLVVGNRLAGLAPPSVGPSGDAPPTARPSLTFGDRFPAPTNPGDPMSLFDAFRFDGKRVLVVGGATGMGAAAAELALDAGADVVVMDYAEVRQSGAKAIHVNLAEKSIDAAVDDAAVSARPALVRRRCRRTRIDRINFIGHRHLIDRMLARNIGRATIGFISSAAGLGGKSLTRCSRSCSRARPARRRLVKDRDSRLDKQAVCAYVASQAFPMLKRGIRINAICPGPTDTPLAQANKEVWLAFGADYRQELGIQASTPMEQAYPLLFLCSEAASAISGVTLITDAGYMMSGITESFPNATMMAKVLMGRT
jgi:NAD(P)-dependent dehydrogenase (short-subunit alcohol dehydrogenase family)